MICRFSFGLPPFPPLPHVQAFHPAATVPVLHRGPSSLSLAPMKFTLSIVVYLVMAAFIGWGIIAVIHGKPAVLIVSLLAYLVIAAKVGCSETH